MIQVDGLAIAFGSNSLFTNASFTIQQGERCALVGRNGSGKTTLFKLLAGLENADAGTVGMRKNYRLGLLNQHIAFTAPTVIEEASLALREGDEESVYQSEKILFGLGFSEEQLDLAPGQLSGGYQLRLHLAKVLIAEPDCLLLDEPTNYLDIVSITWFTRFLQQWKGEFILISHDREFVDAVSTHTMGIHRGQIKKVKGGTVEFYNQILQDEEIYERTAQNQEKKRAHLQSFIDRFGAKATKAAQAQSRQKMIARIPVLERLKEIYQLDFHFNESSYSSHNMATASNLMFGYQPDVNIINDFSLSINRGERIAILGKNGRGKSTLLRLIAGDLAANTGEVRHKENVQMGYFGQTNIQRLHPEHNVEEEISSANPLLTYTEVKGICGLMMFSGDNASKKTALLSGGEKSRVLLGKILAKPCNLLLFDEPTHHLDMESIEALIDAIEDFNGAVVIVTHSELILKRMQLDKIVICREGSQELFEGDYETFLGKIGWDDGEQAKGKKKGKGLRGEKQIRAELVAERAKALKPIEKEISQIEQAISKAEQKQSEILKALIELTQNQGSGTEIQELTKVQSKEERVIFELYQKWEEVMAKREEIQVKYSEVK